ncbi:dihydrofolate reductase family protein [Cohnella herbarum]|uniref:dihydrofolate reductase family protein n=1 Tax=Cohnella herbarum TaxID=2728023 RepID=UPI0020C384EE
MAQYAGGGGRPDEFYSQICAYSGHMNRTLMAHNLIDEYHFIVNPVVVGKEKPRMIFPGFSFLFRGEQAKTIFAPIFQHLRTTRKTLSYDKVDCIPIPCNHTFPGKEG